MDIKYSLDENGRKYIPVTHKRAVKGINLDILDNFSDNEGHIRALQDFDFDNISKYLKSGFYYVKSAKNSPNSEHSTGYLQVMSRSTTYKKIIFIPFNQNRIYLRHELGKDKGWTGWTVIRHQSNEKDLENLNEKIDGLEKKNQELQQRLEALENIKQNNEELQQRIQALEESEKNNEDLKQRVEALEQIVKEQ